MNTDWRKAYRKWGLPPVRQSNYALSWLTALSAVLLVAPLAILFLNAHVAGQDELLVVIGFLFVPATMVSIYLGSIPDFWSFSEERENDEHLLIARLEPDEGVPQYVYRIAQELLAQPQFADYTDKEIRKVIFALIHNSRFNPGTPLVKAIKAKMQAL